MSWALRVFAQADCTFGSYLADWFGRLGRGINMRVFALAAMVVTIAAPAFADTLPDGVYAAVGLECNELTGFNITAVSGNSMTIEGGEGKISNVKKAGSKYEFDLTHEGKKIKESVTYRKSGDMILTNKFGTFEYKSCN